MQLQMNAYECCANANDMLMLKLTALYSSGGKRDGACTREGGKCNARAESKVLKVKC